MPVPALIALIVLTGIGGFFIAKIVSNLRTVGSHYGQPDGKDDRADEEDRREEE